MKTLFCYAINIVRIVFYDLNFLLAKEINLLSKISFFIKRTLAIFFPIGSFKLNGYKHQVYQKYCLFHFTRDFHEVKELLTETELLNKNANLVDVGANVGTFSYIAKLLNPKLKIICFEPVGFTYNHYLKNNLSKFDDIKLFNIGLGASKSQAEVNVGKNLGGISILSEVNPEDNKEIIHIDTFDKLVDFKKIDFVKIDIEGYEPFCLQGAQKKLKNISYIYLEKGPQNDLYEILAEIKDYFFLKNIYSLRPQYSFEVPLLADLLFKNKNIS